MTEDEGTWKNRRQRMRSKKEKDQQTEQRKSWRDGKNRTETHMVNRTTLTLNCMSMSTENKQQELYYKGCSH